VIFRGAKNNFIFFLKNPRGWVLSSQLHDATAKIKPTKTMKTTKTPTLPCKLSDLISAHPEGVSYQEKYAVGWLDGDSPEIVPERLKTLASNNPEATVIVFGDETIGIEINGAIWAAEQPHPERGAGKQIKIPRSEWQWIHWAADHKIGDGMGGFVNFGDTSDLRKS
jgi:hypothetical protein